MPVSVLMFVNSPEKAIEKLLSEWIKPEQRKNTKITSVYKSGGHSGYFKVYYKIHKKKIVPPIKGFRKETGGFSGWRWFPIYGDEK